MAGIFLFLWNRSITAGWLILAVILLRLLLKKAPRSACCWLWALVGVRLAAPAFRKTPLSLIPSLETIPQRVLTDNSFQINSGIYAFNSTVNQYLGSQAQGPSLAANHVGQFLQACSLIWLAGMALLLLWGLAGWLRLRRQVAEAVPEEGVWLCGAVSSPFLLGLFRPRIYLPLGLETEIRTYVVAHERAHIRRRDHWSKPAAFLLLTVYWFQPLVWVAYVLLCRDIELACDQRVIRELGPACKKAYSQALLRCSVRRSPIAAGPLAFGEADVKKRVKNVLDYKRPAFWAAAVSLLAVVITGICFLTDPEGPAPAPAPTVLNTPDGSAVRDAHAYSGGALLYQDMAISSYFSDSGGLYSHVTLDGNSLILTDSRGDVERFVLKQKDFYEPEDIYRSDVPLRFLAEEEEWTGRTLLPEDAEGITRYLYAPESGDGGEEAIWEISRSSGGKRMWIGSGIRLFALIDLRENIPNMAEAVFWTYDPSYPTLIPVRFDLEGGAGVWTADGWLTLDPNSGEKSQALTVEEGQTIYWQPSGEGAPTSGAALQYSCAADGPAGREEDSLSLRPMMDYEGLYGGRTYGISQDWLGAYSSRLHMTRMEVDGSTGELAVSRTGTDREERGRTTVEDYPRSGMGVVWDTGEAGERGDVQ